METLKVLLAFYGAIVVMNALLSALFWRKLGSPLFGYLAAMWAATIVTSVFQGTFQEGALQIVLAYSTAYPVYLFQGSILARLSGVRLPMRRVAWVAAAGFAGTLAAHFAGLGFAFVALPTAVALAFPIADPTLRVLAGKTPKATFAIRALAVTNFVFVLHMLDYPFLRTHAQLAPYGFTVGFMLLIATSILAPATVLEDAAQQAARVREEFLSIASHELRTPLTPLKLQLQLARRTVESSGAARAELLPMLDSADRNLHRIVLLVEELLDVSRMAQNQVALQRDRLDLVVLARQVLDQFGEQLSRVGCTGTLEADGEVIGNWDKLRLEQVLVNLVSNAVKYAPGSAIRVSVRGVDGLARVSVSDGGAGIAPEDHGRIFERFERAQASGSVGGLGLGLYIARTIVELHGGVIGVESAPGKGATFTVELPRG